MNRWLLAVALGAGSFLTGAFFEVMSGTRTTIDFDKVGTTAFCRVATDAQTTAGLPQPDTEQRAYLQTARQLVIFKKLLSGGRRFLVLYSDSSHGAPITLAREAAEKLGVELVERPVKTTEELTAAFEQTTIDKVDGVLHIPDDWVDRHAGLIFETARMKRLPTMTFGKAYVTQGALASYGAELYKCELRKNRLTDQISMADGSKGLFQRQIERSFMEINLKTAKEIGLEIPAMVLQRADNESNELIVRRML